MQTYPFRWCFKVFCTFYKIKVCQGVIAIWYLQELVFMRFSHFISLRCTLQKKHHIFLDVELVNYFLCYQHNSVLHVSVTDELKAISPCILQLPECFMFDTVFYGSQTFEVTENSFTLISQIFLFQHISLSNKTTFLIHVLSYIHEYYEAPNKALYLAFYVLLHLRETHNSLQFAYVLLLIFLPAVSGTSEL